jgi:2-polyprenyl-3-methyl-5-hydroxy-6-metoxy-1,4-benzoquinol methylase
MYRVISLLDRVRFVGRFSLWVRRNSGGRVRRAIWDTEYSIGRWRYLDKQNNAGINGVLSAYVDQYARGGSILDVGCGTGTISQELPLDSYSLYTGVDVSTVAIETAQARCDAARRAKTRFYVGDVTRFQPPGLYNLILLKEVLYYLTADQIRTMLTDLSRVLVEDGVFVVINHERYAYSWITDLIEADYTVLERHCPPESKLIALVFRAR